MTEHDNATPRDVPDRNRTHAFTDPNPFLSEDRTLHLPGHAARMQRALNAVTDHEPPRSAAHRDR
jgi:hypothetical protein